VAAAIGLFAQGGPGPVPVTSLRGQPTDLYGVGLYRFDSTVLTLAWAPAMIGSAVTGVLPSRLGAYSTEVTWALDLGVVVPAVAATAVLLRARAPLGPLAAAAMLSLNVALGVALVGQGVAQLLADVPMSNGERAGAMASFALMTVIAGVLLSRLLRHLRPPGAAAPRPRRR